MRKGLIVLAAMLLTVVLAILLFSGKPAQSISVGRASLFTYMITNCSAGRVIIERWSVEIKSDSGWTNYPPGTPQLFNSRYVVHVDEKVPIMVQRPDGNYAWRLQIVYGVIPQWKLVVNRWTDKLGTTVFGYTPRVFISPEFVAQDVTAPVNPSKVPGTNN